MRNHWLQKNWKLKIESLVTALPDAFEIKIIKGDYWVLVSFESYSVSDAKPWTSMVKDLIEKRSGHRVIKLTKREETAVYLVLRAICEGMESAKAISLVEKLGFLHSSNRTTRHTESQ